MSESAVVWLSIIGISLTTLVTRGSFVLFGARVQLPAVIERALAYAPACALAAIMAPDLVLLHGTPVIGLGNPRPVAAAVAVLAFLCSRSLVLTIVAGMAAYTAFRLGVGG